MSASTSSSLSCCRRKDAAVIAAPEIEILAPEMKPPAARSASTASPFEQKRAKKIVECNR
jgi:hypothetical protein